QPVWLAPYHYRQKLFRIVINARTGEVVGTRPYSFWKIAFLIIAILAAIAAVGGIVALVNASHRTGGVPQRPPPAVAEFGDSNDARGDQRRQGNRHRMFLKSVVPMPRSVSLMRGVRGRDRLALPNSSVAHV